MEEEMILKLCSGCGKKIEYPKKLCPPCQDKYAALEKEGKAKADRRYNQTRDKKLEAFYHSREWKILSAKRMQIAGYMCEYCKKALAVEVHHEIPIGTPEGWSERLNIDLVRAACTKCHNKKHGRFSPGARHQGKPRGAVQKV
jgi:5-methylcytosine-specific restriction endonuclease McrA